MKEYNKPLVEVTSELAEGVYATSGVSAPPKCDSKYMTGNWEKGDYSTNAYKANQGCTGCPAFTDTACGLTTHYVESGYASSYDVDNGSRMPSWEAAGHGPDDPLWEETPQQW